MIAPPYCPCSLRLSEEQTCRTARYRQVWDAIFIKKVAVISQLLFLFYDLALGDAVILQASDRLPVDHFAADGDGNRGRAGNAH